VPAVGAVVAVVAHHEVIAFVDDLRAEVIVAAVVGRHEAVVERHVIAVDPAADDADLIPFFRDDALDERLLRLQRIVEHHDVADLRIADPVGELVDDEAILILQRRRHAHALDAGHLEAERDDQRRVDGG
jgi:hypothetical protein